MFVISARTLYQRKTGQDLANVSVSLKENLINDYSQMIQKEGLDHFWNEYGFSNFPK